MLSEEEIRDALRVCYDPAIPLNIVDLGLIETISLTLDADAPGTGIPGVPAKYRLHLELQATSPEESLRAQLRGQVHNRLAGLPQLSRISIHFAEPSSWTPARITPEGRRILGLDRQAFPILNNRLR